MTDTETGAQIEAGLRAPAGRDAPSGLEPRPKGMGAAGWLRWGWRQLTSMRTALVLLFLVALAAVPGSVLPQRGQAPEKVLEYLAEHERLGPWLDRLSLFDVFAAPWFAAIYLLLFVSLAGCIIPRSARHWRALRAKPPGAPRNLGRLPQFEEHETGRAPEEVLAQAGELLRRKRFRVADGPGSVAAEKGYLGETGNLVFHIALLLLLLAVGSGALYGYRGNALMTEGAGFANSLAYYDQFSAGRRFSPDALAPFSMRLGDFQARYVTSGDQRGAPKDYAATLYYREDPSAPERTHRLRVNHPLKLGGAKIYLLGHGYAPEFTVRDAQGNVAFRGAVPFLPIEERNYTSEGVIKVPDARPEQLAFQAVFWPSAVADTERRQVLSAFPAPLNPTISLMTFKGNLGLDTGDPQSVYRIEGIGRTLQPVKGGARLLRQGETFQLPDGAGSVTFDGTKEWISLAINRDPGRVPALAAAAIAIAGIVASFMVRRRRVWVRAAAAEGGPTKVEIGGLTLGGQTAEFGQIATELRRATTDSTGSDEHGQ